MLFLSCTSGMAQNYEGSNKESCEFKLGKARVFFEVGQLEKIPPLLTGCTNDKSLSKPVRLSILKLLMETYLFTNEEKKAEEIYVKILNINPFFKIRKSIEHPEVIYLSKKFITEPTFGLGVKAGPTTTFVQSTKEFTFEPNVASISESFSNTIGYHLGVFVNYQIPKTKIELTTEVLYAKTDYNYDAFIVSTADNQDADLKFGESYKTLSIPLIAKLNFRENTRGRKALSYYAYLGASYDIIIAARIDDINLLTRTNGVLGGPGGSSGLDILNGNYPPTRKKSNFSALAGIGLKFRIKTSHLFLDLRYQYTLQNIVETDNRFKNTKLQVYWHVDNDLKWHNLYFSMGYCYTFYKVRR